LTKIYFSVTNDLTGDQRVHRIISTLVKAGASVTLAGRRFSNSLPLETRSYKTYRLRLLFNSGPAFYACYNFRLFLYLLSRWKIDILVANDLDSLPANFIVSWLRRVPLVYDSHEYFTEVPELIGREKVRNIWLRIEKWILPRLKIAYTVSKPIADSYKQKYGTDFEIIHNYPLKKKAIKPYQLPFSIGGDKLLIYQGAVNIGRGLELLIETVSEIENVKLVIAGDGDIRKSLENKIFEMGFGNKVFLIGKIPFEQLHSLTAQATAGVSLEEDMGLNYRYAMPNKLFDYIQAGIPVIVSSLPEMKKVVEKYKIGIIAETKEKDELSLLLKTLLFDEEIRAFWKQGLRMAADELCWENEEKLLIEIFRRTGIKFIIS
jgi:glycosyltransferase involved in cell wall biosynthesis